jgi:hypothetical protein
MEINMVNGFTLVLCHLASDIQAWRRGSRTWPLSKTTSKTPGPPRTTSEDNLSKKKVWTTEFADLFTLKEVWIHPSKKVELSRQKSGLCCQKQAFVPNCRTGQKARFL